MEKNHVAHIIVHATDVLTFKRCRRLWDWSSRYRQNYEPVRPVSHFFIGRAFHHCVEQLTSDGIPPRVSLAVFLRDELRPLRAGPLWNLVRPEVREYVRLIKALMDHYTAFVGLQEGPYADVNLDYLAHEMAFGDGHTDPIPLRVDGKILDPPVYVGGKFDGLVRHRPTTRYLLPEYKTCRSIVERSKLLPHDEQATFYCYAAQELFGQPVSGVLYTLARKKAPVQPRVLQNGMLSTAKSIDTTVAGYREAIRVHHGVVSEAFIQKHYGEILDHLQHFSEPFVQRVLIKRTPVQIDLFIRELHATALEMFDSKTVMYASREWSCPGCHFRDPCLKRDMGDEDGVQFALQYEYQQRVHDEPLSTEADV